MWTDWVVAVVDSETYYWYVVVVVLYSGDDSVGVYVGFPSD